MHGSRGSTNRAGRRIPGTSRDRDGLGVSPPDEDPPVAGLVTTPERDLVGAFAQRDSQRRDADLLVVHAHARLAAALRGLDDEESLFGGDLEAGRRGDPLLLAAVVEEALGLVIPGCGGR